MVWLLVFMVIIIFSTGSSEKDRRGCYGNQTAERVVGSS